MRQVLQTVTENKYKWGIIKCEKMFSQCVTGIKKYNDYYKVSCNNLIIFGVCVCVWVCVCVCTSIHLEVFICMDQLNAREQMLCWRRFFPMPSPFIATLEWISWTWTIHRHTRKLHVNPIVSEQKATSIST